MTDETPAKPRALGARIRRWLALLGFSVLVTNIIFFHITAPREPQVELPTPGKIKLDGETASLSHAQLERRDGYWFFTHAGDALTMGVQHAALGGFMTQRIERLMLDDLKKRAPGPVRVILPGILMWEYRHMADYISEPRLEELWGFSQTYADPQPFPLNAYRRGLYYHALHDITQELVGNRWVDPGIAGACTGFAASGSATTNGHLIVGRNFDFEVLPIFDREKVVHLYARRGTIPMLSVSWMAMVGVLTGINAEGIWLSINSARSEGKNRKGPPIAILGREILEHAASIEDARRILADNDPMVSDIYLVGDGKTGEVVAFERGQTRMDERTLVNERIAVSNHLLSPTFEGDEGDAGMRAWTTTLARGLRMQEMVDAEPLSVDRGVQILRDRKGPGGRPLAPGNRNAIDALIASHAVVADATDRVLWVSTSPHTQGAFRAIDLFAELEAAGIDATPWKPAVVAPPVVEPPAAQIAATVASRDIGPGDLIQNDGAGWARVQRYRAFLDDAEAYLEADVPEYALKQARRASAMEPLSANAMYYQGAAHRDAGRTEQARAAFTAYLERYPSFGPMYGRVIEWLEANGGVPEVSRADVTSPGSLP